MGVEYEITSVAIDFEDSEVNAKDVGGQAMLGQVKHQTFSYNLFPYTNQATMAADTELHKKSYPYSMLQIKTNRNTFKLEPGDAFLFSYSPMDITNIVYRVLRITEDEINSEALIIHAIKDRYYLSSFIGGATESPSGFGDDVDVTDGSEKMDFLLLEKLYNIKIVEIPYVAAADKVMMGFLVGREKLTEIGFLVYYSHDGTTYSYLGKSVNFAVHGILTTSYLSTTTEIDDNIGFRVEFDNDDVDRIETISRAGLFTGLNIGFVNDEIILFQTITPISGDVYELTGNIRGCFDTEKATHSIGDDFYYIPLSNVSLFTNDQLLVGTTKYFKLIPYNSAYTASITDADANTHSIVGRARKPYVPGGFLATGNLITNDIVLTWSPRVRGTGAGIGDADTITDASPTWEGYFEVEVWVGGVKKRTQTAIDAVTWTYTEAMNIIDNGTAQTDVTFKLKNYRTSDTITYSSAWTTAEAGW